MVEMEETATILHHATSHSLIILDEIGRGTSTYDGLAIARAVVEHLHTETMARTLFATHYHELAAIANELSHLSVYTMAISDDEQDGIVFLHRVIQGSIGRSYGVHVAKLAGMPQSVVKRAETVLQQLERKRDDEQNGLSSVENHLSKYSYSQEDMKLVAERQGAYAWQSEEARAVARALEGANGSAPDMNAINVYAITPLDALNLLFLMQKKKSMLLR